MTHTVVVLDQGSSAVGGNNAPWLRITVLVLTLGISLPGSSQSNVPEHARRPLQRSARIDDLFIILKNAMPVDHTNLIWIDLEMTGLDPATDRIIEIATVVTDKQLNVVAEGPVLAINQPDSALDSMDEWNTKQHGSSGLVERVRASDIDESGAERQTLEFLRCHIEPGQSPMCGNSICQDRRFMARLMPDLERFFHYRNLDVSTLKELSRRWYPDIAAGFFKESTHLALQDIHDSIEELRYYRRRMFVPE